MPGTDQPPYPFPEDRVLYLTTRQAFTSQHAIDVQATCAGTPVDWPVVLELAIQHHVAPLVFHNLEKVPLPGLHIPKQVLVGFKRAQIDNILLKKDARLGLEEAVRLFNQNNIEIMLVKGAALNLIVYAQPWYTLSWDIDLVTRLPREAYDPLVLEPVLHEFEFRNQINHRHLTKIEYDFYAHHDVTMNGLLPLDIECIWTDSQTLQVGDGHARVMAPEDLLITAAISAHRKRYFLLKNLCDLAEIVHCIPGLDWDLVAKKARTYRCNAIVYAALQVTLRTLGAPVPNDFFPGLQVSSFQSAAIDRLVGITTRKVSLRRLSSLSQRTYFGRHLSWSLALTYASYRPEQVARAIGSIFHFTF